MPPPRRKSSLRQLLQNHHHLPLLRQFLKLGDSAFHARERRRPSNARGTEPPPSVEERERDENDNVVAPLSDDGGDCLSVVERERDAFMDALHDDNFVNRADREECGAVEESSPLERIPDGTIQDGAISNRLPLDNPARCNRDEEERLETHAYDFPQGMEIVDLAALLVVDEDTTTDGEYTSPTTSLSYNPIDLSEESRSVPHSSPSDSCRVELAATDFHPGDRVRVCVTHPKHRDKRGTVMGATPCFVKVLLEGSETGKPTLLAAKFLTVVPSESASTILAAASSIHTASECTGERGQVMNKVVFDKGDYVHVLNTHREHGNKSGVVIRTTNCFVIFVESCTNKEIRIQPKFLSRTPAVPNSPHNSPYDGSNSDECSVVSSDSASRKRPVRKVSYEVGNRRHFRSKPNAIVNPEPAQFVLERLCYGMPHLAADSAFRRIWEGKYHIREYDLPLGKQFGALPPLERKVQFRGKNYELYYADVKRDPTRGVPFRAKNGKAKKVVSYYVQTNDLRQQEESLAGFGSLNPRKVWARRQLFLSEAAKLPNEMGMQTVTEDDIAMVKDDGTVGCGFIGEQYLEALLGGGVEAQRTIGIQVRIFVPSLGVFKGVLVRKPHSAGPPIRLNESLRKVLPSALSNAAGIGCMVIKQTFPSKANLQIGRLFRRDRKVTKSFQKSVTSNENCKLSDLYVRLLHGLGVPKQVTDEYSKRYRNVKHLRHTHLVGVADPTGKLPPNTVFMTGVKRGDVDVEKVFVTRPPCLEPEDGRVLELITTRPHGMSQKEWDWLNSLYFGALVFANPTEGRRPLPELIADGDLDGDLYFVCWDKEIVSNIVLDDILDDALCASDEQGTVSYDEDWFDKTQTFISEVGNIVCLHDLIGFLYNQSKDIADKKSIRDADAIAFAKAYKQALEFRKHGEKICIPAHLWMCLPDHFHNFCQSV